MNKKLLFSLVSSSCAVKRKIFKQPKEMTIDDIWAIKDSRTSTIVCTRGEWTFHNKCIWWHYTLVLKTEKVQLQWTMKICVVVDPYIPTSYKTNNFKIPYWEKLKKIAILWFLLSKSGVAALWDPPNLCSKILIPAEDFKNNVFVTSRPY